MNRVRLLALACLSAMTLTACGGGTASTTGSPSAGPSAEASAAPAASATTGAGSGSGGVTASALCDYLRDELPALRKAPGEIEVMARLATGLSGWYDQRGGVPDGTEIDTLTKEQCADVRTEVLELAGVQSFLQL
ncbi:hypothetical protein [Micromonospora cremea]|uniref:Lipoprotein n=1 Tax=Micromonospora cremea TaxID=709881 RepID=A0A1N5W7B9_9ACTN|nr:hypothetical protein [Micromonospora cremea]SIM81186.1 hypothetical protein SAMN04489832_2228 [Micromonospora cremea]